MTLGTFDGVHLGHRQLVGKVVERARAIAGEAVVYSFYPPPWRVLGTARNPYLLTTFEDKASLLHGLGVDVLVTEEFTPEIQALNATRFAEEVIQARIHPKEIHVGYDFAFGKDRQGDAAFLKGFFEPQGTAVRQMEPVWQEGGIVSCTSIREHLVAGRVEEGARLLGRWHFISGAVVRGRGRGRGIGFPTANIQPRTEMIPPSGVYAVRLTTAASSWEGVANLGYRPTFSEREFAIEAHLFDFTGDLYGEPVRLHFIERIREERRFSDVAALITQITEDVEAAKRKRPYPLGPIGYP